MIIMLFMVSLLIFLLPYLTGSDPATTVLRARVSEGELSETALSQLREELGLNKPVAVQYITWLGQLAKGDLGRSFVSRAPVAGIIYRGLKATVILTLLSIGIALIVALFLGIFSALRPGGKLDNLITAITQIGVAVPEFWLAPVLILVFAIWLKWLPSAGWGAFKYMVLPTIVLSIRPIAYFTSLTRISMIEVLQMDFINAARAKGLSESKVIWRHAIRNTLIPVITMVTLWFASLLGGSVIVEVIFAVPGIGRVLYDAVIAKDFPVLQTGVVIIVSFTVIINTLTDLAYTLMNPSISLDGSKM
jgi:peptide/nickel transport system permease protein